MEMCSRGDNSLLYTRYDLFKRRKQTSTNYQARKVHDLMRSVASSIGASSLRTISCVANMYIFISSKSINMAISFSWERLELPARINADPLAVS